MNARDESLTEAHIADLVRRFYGKAAADPELQAIFDATIDDWDAHHRVVENFWSHALLQTDRYHGTPYPVHARLHLKLEHFDRWLALFRETAVEVLPAEAAGRAIAKAEQMAEGFKHGMFFDYNPGKSR